jgi:hypothetical protein
MAEKFGELAGELFDEIHLCPGMRENKAVLRSEGANRSQDTIADAIFWCACSLV